MELDNTVNFTGLVERGNKGIIERYRPRRFHELVGNEMTKKALANWMAQGEKRSKSLLFVGPSGCGKTTISRILAMGLNCEHGDTVNPCCECPSCKTAMQENMAMHIKEYNMSATSTKDDADNIVNSMKNSCFTGRNTVFILDEIQTMSNGSQNLMLKTLEDPPPNTYIFMCTTDPQKILKTVQTRCVIYDVRHPGVQEIKGLLSSVVEHEMPKMPLEQRKEIFEASKGMGCREILRSLDKFMLGGGTGDIKEIFQQDFAGIAKAVVRGDFSTVLAEIAKEDNEDNFDANKARMVVRAFLSNEIEYSMKKGDVQKAEKMLRAFRVFDKGFYMDIKPLPSFKADLFEACLIINK